MNWPRIIVERSEKRYPVVFIGVFVILSFVAANVILNIQIKAGQAKQAITQKQLLSLKQPLDPKFARTVKLDSSCPGEQAGNPDAKLTIKYFYSQVCFWCVLEDQNFAEILAKEGQAFKLEKYDREKCDDAMQKYKLSLTPSFVFSTKNDPKEYTVDGYIAKEDLAKIICDVTGYCMKVAVSPTPVQPIGQKVKIYFQ